MPIFNRKKSIPINLGTLTMQQIMNFPKKEETGSEGFYLKEVFRRNHVQIAVAQSRSYTSGLHDFEYDEEEKKITIYSRYRKKAFLLYGYVLMPLLVFIWSEEVGQIMFQLMGIMLVLFVFLSLVLILGIKAESKEIEREMVMRINYLRKNEN